MLVLSRKPGEEIVIAVPPSNVEQIIIVKNCGTYGDRMKIGTKADPLILVHRREVYDARSSQATDSRTS